MSKYKLSHLDCNMSLLHVLNKIEVPPLSLYESSICNTVCELCQLRDNLYSREICIDMTDITAMINNVCSELPSCFTFIDCFIVLKLMLKCVLLVRIKIYIYIYIYINRRRH